MLVFSLKSVTDEDDSQKLKVLLVEPDKVTREFISDLISAKANCDFALSLNQATEKIFKNNYDLVITEISLKERNTLELIRQIKKESPHTITVILTDKEHYLQAAASIRMGAIDILQKPFTVEGFALLFEKFFSIYSETEKDLFLHSAVVEKSCSYILPTSIERLYQFTREFILVLKKFPTMNRKNLEAIRLAIYEILLNAIEHGNLEIDFQKKKKLLQSSSSSYYHYLQDLCKQDPYRDRKIFLDYRYQHSQLEIVIEDEGRGFDANTLPDMNQIENLEELNGRGILISRFNMDKVFYNEKGNRVTLVKNL